MSLALVGRAGGADVIIKDGLELEESLTHTMTSSSVAWVARESDSHGDTFQCAHLKVGCCASFLN